MVAQDCILCTGQVGNLSYPPSPPPFSSPSGTLKGPFGILKGPIKGEEKSLSRLAAAPLRRLSAADPYHKMSDELRAAVHRVARGRYPSLAESAAYAGKVRAILFVSDERALKPLAAEAGALSGHVRSWNGLHCKFVAAELPLPALLDLASRPAVRAAWHDDLLGLELDRTVPHLGAADVHQMGWLGDEARVAIIDTGVDSTHPALPNVIASRDFTCAPWEPECCNPDDTFGHGTDVAGIVGSNDATYTGMAPGARIINAKVMEGCNLSGWTSTTIAGVDWALANGASVINMSLRDLEATRYDGNSQIAKYVDYVVHTAGVTWVKSAGNSGPGCAGTDGTGHVTSPADAYNVVSVGWETYEFNAIHDCSSIGYTDDDRDGAWDDRCAVRLCAPGSAVTSTNNNWETQDDFTPMSGSSMAAPHVSGLAALLWDYGFRTSLPRDPELLRAVMMNTARHILRKDRSPWQNTSTRPLDQDQGAGEIDAAAALQLYANPGRYALISIPQTAEGQSHWYSINVTNAPTVIRATLCWDRHVSDYAADPPPCNDLDLGLYRCPTAAPLASSVSPGDNVEHIWFPALENGKYWLQVRANALPAGDETAALACSHAMTDAGANPVAAQPSVSVTSPAQGSRVRGVVALSAQAAAEAGVERVEFMIDGAPLCADYTAPYQCQWDTRPASVREGTSQVCARAGDYCGQDAINCVTVTVDNTTFDDVPKDYPDWAAVEALARAHVTHGCSRTPPLFCPQDRLTRAQAAKLICLAAGKGPLNRAVPTFADAPKTNMFYPWIERLADAASWAGSPVTWGCNKIAGKRYFCPYAAVTREQMAAFLCRATIRPPAPTCSGVFADVSAFNPFCGYIERLADPAWWPQGVPASDCDCPPSIPPGSRCYCPKSPMTRAQAASFISPAFSLPFP